MSLRAVCLAALLSAACSSAAAHAPYVLQSGHIDLEIGPDGNTVIFDAPEGLVVVDTGRHAAHSQAILDHADAAGKPVAAVVNTHWHLDHATGNVDLFAAWPDARFIATGAAEGALSGFLAGSIERTRAMVADPSLTDEARGRARRSLAIVESRAAFVPAEPVTESGPVMLAGRRLELHVAKSAATEADLWLVAPDEELAVVGDLVVAPVPFFDTGCEEGWRKALADIAAAEWTTVIPGHGAPMTRTDFDRWRGAFESWLDCAASDSPVATCTDGWMRDAAGFYSAEEAGPVREMADYYVTEVLRAPASERMSYCASAT